MSLTVSLAPVHVVAAAVVTGLSAAGLVYAEDRLGLSSLSQQLRPRDRA